MLSSPFIDKVFGWMNASLAADTISRLNYYCTGWLIITACVIVGLFQNWSGLDISCWLPAGYKDHNIREFLEEKCYYGALELKRLLRTGVNYESVNFIHHYPYLLECLIIFFAGLLIIHWLWIVAVRKAGSIEAWLVMVVQEYGRKPNPENSDLQELCTTYKDLFKNLNAGLLWSRIGIQFLYIAAGICEILYLNYLISSQIWSWWAITALAHIFLGNEYDFYFPLEVWCATSHRALANTHFLDMNCTLGLNVWYERIATTFWIYLIPLSICNVGYLVYLLSLIIPYFQMSAMTNIVSQPTKAKSETFQKFVRRIGPDGIYILGQLERLTTKDYASRVTKALYESYNEDDVTAEHQEA